MLVSRSDLAEFIDLNIDDVALCEKLTALGLEVEGLTLTGENLAQVVVGLVTELSAHPDAEKLRVANVDIGQTAPVQIVCGAPNVAVGVRVPTALVGASLPNDLKIKASKLRGVESFGMLCSAKELALSEESSGLMLLPDDAPVGMSIADYLQLKDSVIELGITPNRGDCLSVLGVARELSAVCQQPLTALALGRLTQAPSNISDSGPIAVNLSAPEACPSYLACVMDGIDNTGTSPLWLQEKLRRNGLRSLSPLVDIGNLVMLEFGTPLHLFDRQKIGNKIIVRYAQAGEKISLLNDKEVVCGQDMLLIADEHKPLAIAGIMGGADSAVSTTTQQIVLEAAWFAPQIIAGRSKRLGINTDAGYRFERGVDYALQLAASARALELIQQLCGGNIQASILAQAPEHLPKRNSIALPFASIAKVLGVEIDKNRVISMLQALNMQVSEADQTLQVTPPSYRFDMNIAEDVLEEIARSYGYDHIPIAPLAMQTLAHQSKTVAVPNAAVHQTMLHLGYQEAISYSFIDKKGSEQLELQEQAAIELLNPISEELSHMRRSLLASLLKALQHNTNRQQRQVSLYEIGSGFYRADSGSQSGIIQQEKLAFIRYGQAQSLQWGFRERTLDFFDIKGDLEYLLGGLASQIAKQLQYVESSRSYLHPGQSAEIMLDGESVGFIGTLHPRLQKQYGFDDKVLFCEIDLAILQDNAVAQAKEVGKYPVVRRDICVVVKQNVSLSAMLASLKKASSKLVSGIVLFDVYVGKSLGRGMKSMTFAIYLEDNSKTLTDAQADKTIEKLLQQLSVDFQAELRG